MLPAHPAPHAQGAAPTGSAPLARNSAEALARILKAIADPTRLQLLSMILGNESGGVTVSDLVSQLAFQQPTISHHLKILHDAAIVTRRQEGRTVIYTLAEDFRGPVSDILR